jgi:[acyl-carrier-protein] S-malonyltransferase
VQGIVTREDLQKRVATAAFAFRGYDSENVGRSPELLEHRAYGPIVRASLDSASELCSDVLGREVDLAVRVEARAPSTLGTFVEDIATIVAMELAQLRLLEDLFEVDVRRARMSFGHSIGELSSLVLGGVYEMEQLLPVPLSLAQDCAELTPGTTMGLLSIQGGVLDSEDVQHLCASVSSQGHGLVGPSTYLSPYKVLLLGQGDTLERLEREMPHFLHGTATLRQKPNRFPPLHTPLVWERNIPNRTAMAMHHISGGHQKPAPPIVSCTTGEMSYDEYNSRSILADWTDHPQRLWDVTERTLASGVDLVIHTGPEPKLIPTAFERLSSRVMKQLKRAHLERLGYSVIPSIGRNGWLTRNLPGNAVLLRAPFLGHIVLEDWLLAQEISQPISGFAQPAAPPADGHDSGFAQPLDAAATKSDSADSLAQAQDAEFLLPQPAVATEPPPLETPPEGHDSEPKVPYGVA